MAGLRPGAEVVLGSEVEARRRGRARRFAPGCAGRVLLPPEGGYVVVEFEHDGWGWLCDVPVGCVEAVRSRAAGQTRTGVAA